MNMAWLDSSAICRQLDRWIFTDGRQPFTVAPNLNGADQVWQFAAAVSPGVSGEILLPLIALTLIYVLLLVVEIVLLVRYTGVPGGYGTVGR